MLAPAVLFFGFITAAAAAEPVCNAFNEGITGCFANKQCICRFDPGGSLAGRPPGYRWNCGVLRPACELPPPALPGVPLPPSLALPPGFFEPPYR